MTEEQELEQLAAEIESLEELAKEVVEVEKKAEFERARSQDGTYKPDDPTTSDINEAWVEVKPKSKKEKKKKEPSVETKKEAPTIEHPKKEETTKQVSAQVLYGKAKIQSKLWRPT